MILGGFALARIWGLFFMTLFYVKNIWSSSWCLSPLLKTEEKSNSVVHTKWGEPTNGTGFGSAGFHQFTATLLSSISGLRYTLGSAPKRLIPSSRDLLVFVYESNRLAKANFIDAIQHQRPKTWLSAAEKGFFNTFHHGGRIPVTTRGLHSGRFPCTIRTGVRRLVFTTLGNAVHALMEILTQEQHNGPSNTKYSGKCRKKKIKVMCSSCLDPFICAQLDNSDIRCQLHAVSHLSMLNVMAQPSKLQSQREFKFPIFVPLADWEKWALYWLPNISDLRSSLFVEHWEWTQIFCFLCCTKEPGAQPASKPIFEPHDEEQALSLHQHAKEQLPITAKESFSHW